jgi:uncharacterized membrane protein
MSTIARAVDVDVPVSTAYNQWTQFEQFPLFMEGVERVQQLDDRHLDWTAEIGGVRRRWQAEIVEQIPDERIAWHSTSGTKHAGRVTFHPIGLDRCRVDLQMAYEPDGPAETLADWLGVVTSRIERDLQRFKTFIEHRREETGAWRGTI